MIIREHYLKKIRPFVESDLIKIITGIRRCGKSVIMGQLEAELRAAGKRTLKLNFEDRSVGRTIRNADELVDRRSGSSADGRETLCLSGRNSDGERVEHRLPQPETEESFFVYYGQ